MQEGLSQGCCARPRHAKARSALRAPCCLWVVEVGTTCQGDEEKEGESTTGELSSFLLPLASLCSRTAAQSPGGRTGSAGRLMVEKWEEQTEA